MSDDLAVSQLDEAAGEPAPQPPAQRVAFIDCVACLVVNIAIMADRSV